MSDTPKNGKEIYIRLLKQIGNYWPLFIITALGNIVYSSVDSYATYLFKPLLDKGFVGGDSSFLKILPFIVVGLFLLRGISGFVSTYCMGWLSRRVVYLFRGDMFNHLLKLPAQYYDETTTGQLLAKITYNVEQVANCNNQALTTFVRQGCLVVGLLIVMFLASWKLSLLIFIICPFVILVVKYATKRFRLLSTRIQQSMGNLTQTAEESISGYREIRVFEGQAHQRNLFMKILDYNFQQEMKLNFTGAVSTPIVQFFGAIVLAIVIYVAFNVMKGISAGSFVTLFSAMLLILNPIKQLTRVNATIQRGIAAAESIYALIDTPLEEETGSAELASVKKNISIEKVSFQYPHADEPILKAVSLDVACGTTVALVGRSGSGKSSLVSLLTRFYQPTEGVVKFDGVDIQTLSLMNVRSHISVVSQHVNLFDESIRHNIAFGDLERADEKAIVAAAKAAHAWDFIEQMPEGLDTIIGEDGTKLSGGQRQRLAIARAILKDAPILILDEATSALDNESERAVQKAIENLKRDRTTIVIAHRLSTIESADKIVVLDAGVVVEQGSHNELIDQQGIYYQLHQAAVV